MKKQTLWYRLLLFCVTLIIAVLSFTACEKSYDAAGESNSVMPDKSLGSYEDSNGGIGNVPTGTPDDPNAKIIKTANATLTTLEYDAFIEKLYLKITELEGYTDSDSFSGSKPYRYASITARIPTARLDTFKDFLSGNAVLTHYSAKKQDVSIRYATLTAELETLRDKRDAISALLEKATTLSEIQSLTTARADVDTEINKITAELNTYDEKIAYSTVYVNVNETREYVEPTVEKKGVFKRIGEGFVNSLKGVGTFLVEFFVWFVSAIPYIILIGAIGTGAFFALAKIRRFKNRIKASRKEGAQSVSNAEEKAEATEQAKEEQESENQAKE